MSKTVKTIVTVTAIAVVGFFGYKIISKKLKELKEGGSNQGGGGQNGGGGQGSGGNQAQTPIDANALASKLFDAFDGCMTDNTAWEEVVSQLRSQSDWDSLSAAYGSRKLKCGWVYTTYDGGLAGAFRSELSSGEVEELNKILKSKGIKTI